MTWASSLTGFYKKNHKIISTIVSLTVFFSILYRKPFSHTATVTGNETFALLIFCIVLWIGNPIPTYVTALLAPFLAVLLKVLVLVDRNNTAIQLGRKEAGELVLTFMMNRMVTIAIGSFVLARALKKSLKGTSFFANLYLKYATIGGTTFNWIILVLILTPMYLAAFIPHEAATMITFDLISPVIFALPADSEIAKVSLLALMLGGNLGGMLSSISTPQNVLLFSSTKEHTSDTHPIFKLTFFTWLKVSIPVTLVAAIGVWLGLLLMWKPWRMNMPTHLKLKGKDDQDDSENISSSNDKDLESLSRTASTSSPSLCHSDVTPLKPSKSKTNPTNLTTVQRYWTFLVAAITVFLWLSARYLQDYFGGLAVVSFFPVIALFGAGVLDKDDLHALPWDIVLLAMGATTLSAICKNSGLFDIIEKEFETILKGLTGWFKIALLCSVMTFSGAIKSRYIAALVYLPLAFRAIGSDSSASIGFIVGQKILTAFACSAGMLLPISGLINAFITEIKQPSYPNHRYIRYKDLVSTGALGTFMALLSTVTVGYFIILTF